MFLLAAESIQLFPDGTIFIHIGLILLMIWVLNRTLFRPINRVIESREKHKGTHGSEAEAILADVNQRQTKYNRELLEARSEGYELIEKERSAAVSTRQSELAAAKSETSNTLATARVQLEQEADAARNTIAKEAEVMAEKITNNILKA